MKRLGRMNDLTCLDDWGGRNSKSRGEYDLHLS